jgi:tetratricopeptide (TPR) repeat protein
LSSEALYEQYKEALKRGHVASLRGHVEEALIAYAEAARIAPERSTPHSGAGTALLRRGRPSEALRHYEVALSIAPRDEAALLGRAQALAALDRRGEAADAFDVLAEVQAGGGRLADAVDAARRGLELAEGRERRRTLHRLIERLRATEPAEPGRLALERALQVLDGTAVPHAVPTPATTMPADATFAPPGEPAGTPGTTGAAEAEASPGTATETSGEPPASDEPMPGPGLEPEAPAEGSAPVRPASRLVPPDAPPSELAARADAALDAGLPGEAADALLGLAAVHARDGRIDAALDACYTAVSLDPDSAGLHLALAELYGARGWAALAEEKLDLLDRLTRLDGDAAAAAEVSAARAARA